MSKLKICLNTILVCTSLILMGCDDDVFGKGSGGGNEGKPQGIETHGGSITQSRLDSWRDRFLMTNIEYKEKYAIIQNDAYYSVIDASAMIWFKILNNRQLIKSKQIGELIDPLLDVGSKRNIFTQILNSKVEIVNDSLKAKKKKKCTDVEGNRVSSSTVKGDFDSVICMDAELLSSENPNMAELVALYSHEIVHHFGYDENQAGLIEDFIKNNYNEDSILIDFVVDTSVDQIVKGFRGEYVKELWFEIKSPNQKDRKLQDAFLNYKSTHSEIVELLLYNDGEWTGKAGFTGEMRMVPWGGYNYPFYIERGNRFANYSYEVYSEVEPKDLKSAQEKVEKYDFNEAYFGMRARIEKENDMRNDKIDFVEGIKITSVPEYLKEDENCDFETTSCHLVPATVDVFYEIDFPSHQTFRNILIPMKKDLLKGKIYDQSRVLEYLYNQKIEVLPN